MLQEGRRCLLQTKQAAKRGCSLGLLPLNARRAFCLFLVVWELLLVKEKKDNLFIKGEVSIANDKISYFLGRGGANRGDRPGRKEAGGRREAERRGQQTKTNFR